MTTTLYCQHCKKSYSVRTGDIDDMLRLDTKHLARSKDGYHYDGGCFFKALTRSRRKHRQGEEDGTRPGDMA